MYDSHLHAFAHRTTRLLLCAGELTLFSCPVYVQAECAALQEVLDAQHERDYDGQYSSPRLCIHAVTLQPTGAASADVLCSTVAHSSGIVVCCCVCGRLRCGLLLVLSAECRVLDDQCAVIESELASISLKRDIRAGEKDTQDEELQQAQQQLNELNAKLAVEKLQLITEEAHLAQRTQFENAAAEKERSELAALQDTHNWHKQHYLQEVKQAAITAEREGVYSTPAVVASSSGYNNRGGFQGGSARGGGGCKRQKTQPRSRGTGRTSLPTAMQQYGGYGPVRQGRLAKVVQVTNNTDHGHAK